MVIKPAQCRNIWPRAGLIVRKSSYKSVLSRYQVQSIRCSILVPSGSYCSWSVVCGVCAAGAQHSRQPALWALPEETSAVSAIKKRQFALFLTCHTSKQAHWVPCACRLLGLLYYRVPTLLLAGRHCLTSSWPFVQSVPEMDVARRHAMLTSWAQSWLPDLRQVSRCNCLGNCSR